MSRADYDSLALVLEKAFAQAAYGKGVQRHSVKDEPFEEQLICFLERRGYSGCRFQAAKKIDESLRLDPEAAIQELVGAINYLCAAIIVLQEKIPLNSGDR